MGDIQLSHFFKRTKDETIFYGNSCCWVVGEWFQYFHTRIHFLFIGGLSIINLFYDTKDEFETPLEILLSGSAAKLHGFSLPRNDSREYSSEDFPDFSNFFRQEIIKDFFGIFFVNLMMQLLISSSKN